MTLLGKCTLGGIAEAEAWHWNTYTWQKLGNIVYLISMGDPEMRDRGRKEYYDLRRHFMADEWCEYVDKLNALRARSGGRPLGDIVDEIPFSASMDTSTDSQYIPFPQLSDLHPQKENTSKKTSRSKDSPKVTDKSVQLSLFESGISE